MSNISFGAIITVIAFLVLCAFVFTFFGPGHSLLIQGADYIYDSINASRVGLGL